MSRATSATSVSKRGDSDAGQASRLLVVDDDPLQDIGNSLKMSAVYLDGRPVDRDGIRGALLNWSEPCSLRRNRANDLPMVIAQDVLYRAAPQLDKRPCRPPNRDRDANGGPFRDAE